MVFSDMYLQKVMWPSFHRKSSRLSEDFSRKELNTNYTVLL